MKEIVNDNVTFHVFENIVFEKTLKFLGLSLYLGNSGENKASPQQIP